MLLLDSFEDFKLDNELTALFKNVELVKIRVFREERKATVYIDSPKIIEYSMTEKLRDRLYKQIFHNIVDNVQICVHFSLPEEISLSKIISIYGDSIFEELKYSNMLDFHLLHSSKLTSDDDRNCLDIAMADGLMARKREHDICKWLCGLFKERFDKDIYINISYVQDEDAGRKPDKNEPAMYEIYDTEAKQSYEVSPYEHMAGQDFAYDEKEAKEQKNSAVAKEAKRPKSAARASEKKDYKNNRFKPKKVKDPDIIYGYDCEGNVMNIADITDGFGEVVIQGCIDSSDMRDIAGDRYMVILNVTDYTDTISVKLFLKHSDYEYIRDDIKKGMYVRIKGEAAIDSFDKEVAISRVRGIKNIEPFYGKKLRTDTCSEKRVELHCHTTMSDMDAVSSPESLIERAAKWGHKALAITDHGVVQAFPIAMKAAKSLKKASPEEGKTFKIIYGLEGYLVDDEKPVIRNEKGQSLNDSFVVFDIETTGLNPYKHKIIEIGAVKIKEGIITERFSEFINPLVSIPYEIEELTNINDSMLENAGTLEDVLPKFLEFCKDCVLVAHNADFDVNFICRKAKELGIETDFTAADTLAMSRLLISSIKKFNLKSVSKALGVVLTGHHRAVNDAEATAGIFLKLRDILKGMNIYSLKQVNEYAHANTEYIKKTPSHHIIMLAANDVGRVNMYRLVSESHIKYFNKQPRIPKSLLRECSEGLIIGSACEAGELYQALLRGEDDKEIERIADFYDYFEIQPIGNNSFMLRDRKYGVNEDDLRNMNRRILKLGKQYGKPVCATSDVHFLDPEDEIYRRIIMAGKGFEDADMQPPLYLHTTDEMLDEFSYLGESDAYDVVIKNTNIIADMIEEISPVRPDKCPPVFDNSDSDLRKICFDKAHEMYGDELPHIVEDRLTKELDSIINNGYSVMYIIAQRLVAKSNEDGYLVGSRGSVGSSFAATMAGITEVNPLPAHYYCSECRYSDFDSDEVKAYTDRSGFDMPDRICPVCGTVLKKDGHNIPFETFLGFKGDKEPDIDLNFSGEYQSNAHKYTEVLFGEGNTFRAGTIGTLAEKTAYGYVMKYYEERGIKKRRVEIERIARGCTGVRRTTGQHPGGIVVLPKGENIYSFTPIQRPANDMSVDIITTHFEYHSIDHNLLKLDILGHDDPTMLRMLQDLTGIDVKTIPLNDEKVMSLFYGTGALGITTDDIEGFDLGSLGVPEFGTDFSMQMLRDTLPSTFSELVRISGLSHGTDVWTNNAQDLIKSGECTLSTAICTRDDIMTYLIENGVENSMAFKIMESVRKGKGLTDEMKAAMRQKNIPEWYISSCLKIKYMFPKAHAVAYVMMAIRIAWFKVYEPLAYYAAFFSIRANTFDYEIMAQGRAVLEKKLDELNSAEKLTAKDKEMKKDMRIVQEMYARGIKFEPIDLYRAKAKRFIITDGKLMPSLGTIEGLGGLAAETIETEAAGEPFSSIEDFRERTRLGTKITDKLSSLGIFGSLPQSNQLSIMDFLR